MTSFLIPFLTLPLKANCYQVLVFYFDTSSGQYIVRMNGWRLTPFSPGWRGSSATRNQKDYDMSKQRSGDERHRQYVQRVRVAAILLCRESRNRIHLERLARCNQTSDKSNNQEEKANNNEGRCIRRCDVEQ